MPRKIFRRWVPSHRTFAERKSLRFLQPLLNEPNLFHLNRHSVSVALFAGIFAAFLPTPGQTLIAAALALVLRCNLPIAIALIWISNPFTMAPLFFMTYELGRWLLQCPPMDFSFQLSWEWFQLQGKAIVAPLLLGSVISGLVFGGLGYLCMHQLWRWHVVRNWEARKQKRLSQQPPHS
ncbi:MAG: DUF2062 domain-containing protein [Porticoccaceae bacterium]|nr:DUF2062 domain-containing protein [Porticoccaceae bacterium]